MIDPDRHFLFIHIPKSGGTSIATALEGERRPPVHLTLRHYQRLGPLTLARALAGPQGVEALRIAASKLRLGARERCFDAHSFFSFAVVRNPWSRAASWYLNVMRHRPHLARHGMRGDESFAEFLKYHGNSWGLRPQLYWLRGWDGAVGVDEVGRFEELEEFFDRICARLGIEVRLPELNRAPDPQVWRGLYDPSTVDLVAARYREEVALFGYSFE